MHCYLMSPSPLIDPLVTLLAARHPGRIQPQDVGFPCTRHPLFLPFSSWGIPSLANSTSGAANDADLFGHHCGSNLFAPVMLH